jgi:hypothetical protein
MLCGFEGRLLVSWVLRPLPALGSVKSTATISFLHSLPSTRWSATTKDNNIHFSWSIRCSKHAPLFSASDLLPSRTRGNQGEPRPVSTGRRCVPSSSDTIASCTLGQLNGKPCLCPAQTRRVRGSTLTFSDCDKPLSFHVKHTIAVPDFQAIHFWSQSYGSLVCKRETGCQDSTGENVFSSCAGVKWHSLLFVWTFSTQENRSVS